MGNIHPTAIIEDGAQIADSATIGAYCVIGSDAVIGAHTTLHSHVCVAGNTHIGDSCTIFPFASLGHAPQDLKFKGEESRVEIGSHTVIREYVTINPGTEGGGLLTKVGDHCLLMVSAHVAHDCIVGNHVIMANNATLAGHVQVGDNVVIGGLAAIHQFVRIGRNAMIGGLSGVEHDVIPFGSVMGERANLAGLNLVGMKRRGLSREAIHALRNAYKQLFDESNGVLEKRANQVRQDYSDQAEVIELLDFVSFDSSRSLCVPSVHHG